MFICGVLCIWDKKYPKSYLADNKVQFVADISAAPSLIKSMFILPGLKEFKHTVLIIDDEHVSASYKPTKYNDQIVIVIGSRDLPFYTVNILRWRFEIGIYTLFNQICNGISLCCILSIF